MSTLLFCTSYSSTQDLWTSRYRRWVDYNKAYKLNHDQSLIVDDSSPCLPEWKDTCILNALSDETVKPCEPNVLATFKTHLGRPSTWNYPGWFRSYNFAAKYAVKFNFNKVIHIESDAFVFSERIIDYINNLETGWTSLWSERYNFPETAIQIICKDQLNNFFWFSSRPYKQTYVNSPIETITPFTNVVKRFKGDRYSEFLASVPPEADYCCQFPTTWELPLAKY